MRKKFSDTDYQALKQAFLTFSKKLFRNNELEEIRICLKQKYEFNLNIIHLCCFLAMAHFPPLNKEDIQFIIKRITAWHEKVVEPMEKLYQTVTYYTHHPLPMQGKQRGRSGKTAHQEKVSTVPTCDQPKLLMPVVHLMKRNKMLIEQAEQSFILQVIYRLKDRAQAEIRLVDCALNNIFEYVRYQGITLHNNDFEKIYRLVNQIPNLDG